MHSGARGAADSGGCVVGPGVAGSGAGEERHAEVAAGGAEVLTAPPLPPTTPDMVSEVSGCCRCVMQACGCSLSPWLLRVVTAVLLSDRVF